MGNVLKQTALKVCVNTARKAGDFAVERLKECRQVTRKTPTDFVTDTDYAAEKLIAAEISAEFPEHDLLTEEKLSHRHGSRFIWVVDPLDGTVNYVMGIPTFSVSIALLIDGQVEVGAIYDPLRQEMFAAERGGGATLNNEPIRVSRQAVLAESMVATDFVNLPHAVSDHARIFEQLPYHVGNLRMLGSCCTALAYIACGRLDLFFLLQSKPWDMAAGSLIIEEAGGLVTGWNGPFDCLNRPGLIVGNPRLVAEFTGIINR